MDVHQNRYGRIPSPPDPRNWSLLPFFAEPAATRWWLPVMRPAKIWNLPVLLDQNGYPRCVGYGSTHYIDMDPVLHAFEADYADQFYFDCKKVDGFPNEDGSTIHAAARVLQQRGLIKNYAWAHALGEVREQLLTRGPMDTGVNWYEGMERPDRNGYIVPSGRSHNATVNSTGMSSAAA